MKIILEPCAVQDVTWRSKSLDHIYKSQYSTADCSTVLKFGTVSSHHRRYTAIVQDQKSKRRKSMSQQQKRYNTAMGRFSDFKLGHNKSRKTGVAPGGLRLQCIRIMPYGSRS